MRKDKVKAIQLRLQGKTYNEISNILKVPKSTMSYWFRGKDFDSIRNQTYHEAQRKWSDNITAYNKKRSKEIWKKRILSQEIFSTDIGKISQRELLLIGAILYWAEGYKKTKWCISFCNSDPYIMKIIMKFFREICEVPEDKFRLRVHIHPNISESEAKKYWSQTTKIPIDQFNKTQIIISKSSKFKRPKNILPFGTVHVIISDKNLVDKIMGWIAGMKKIC